MRIMFAGDWHGNSTFACRVIERAATRECSRVLQLGDFGFWPGEGGDFYLEALSAMCEAHNVDLYVIHGNHDDPNRWQNYPSDDETGFRFILSRMFFIPDGARWDWDGVQFGALGGAASVDREWRIAMERDGRAPKVWWPEEMITPEAVRDVCAPRWRTEEPRPLDVLVSHEGPTWTGGGYADGHLGFTVPIYDEARSAMCRALVDTAASLTKPWLHLHGHHHTHGIGYAQWHVPDDDLIGTRLKYDTGVVITLDADVNNSLARNTHILDTETDVPPAVDPAVWDQLEAM